MIFSYLPFLLIGFIGFIGFFQLILYFIVSSLDIESRDE